MPKDKYKMKGRGSKEELNESSMAAAEKAMGIPGKKEAPKPKPADADKKDPADNVRKKDRKGLADNLALKYGGRYSSRKS